MQLNLFVNPSSLLKGEIVVPGDKSISHRAVILASIAKGTTIIHDYLKAEDSYATVQAFQSMGVSIEEPTTRQLIIHGVGKYGLKKPTEVINCQNSGTTLRLLAGLLVAQDFDSVLTGDESLKKRPMERIRHPLSQMGARVETTDNHAPLWIYGGTPLRGIHYQIPEASAQVKSCLLLAGLYAQGKTQLIESTPTRNHTENMLATFSYPIEKRDNSLIIHSQGECCGTDVHIPGDLSSAAFFIVAAVLTPGAQLIIRQVGINPTRTGIIEILTRMGANIEIENKRLYGEELVADLIVYHSPLVAISIPSKWISLAIDEFPIIFIAAACAQGKTILRGARELRVKESDRIAAMATGLNILGIETETFDDGISIQGGVLQGGKVNSFGDHRIAMAFAIAGTVAKQPVTILNSACIQTSFPNFVDLANKIHLIMKEEHVSH